MLYIHGSGHFHPDNIIDNAFFESLDIDTNDEWIVERVGIQQRRTVLSLDYIKETKNKNIDDASTHVSHTLAQCALPAVEMALKRAGIELFDIGMVLASTCSQEHMLPATACLIANELGISHVPCVDLNSACSSFATQMHFADMMNVELSPSYILLVQVENWTKTVDYSDRKTSVLVGDAAAAAIVSKKHPASMRLTHSFLESDPSGWQKVVTPMGKHFYQDGPSVQKFAIKKTIATFRALQEKVDYSLSDNYFISHQANLTMLKSVCAKLGISKEHHLYNVDMYGNCAAAGAPSVLSQHWDTFKSGDNLTVVMVGAGLTWGGMTIQVG
jgi:3-oxoacyl-[acyl-carrier-protein] synthase-3